MNLSGKSDFASVSETFDLLRHMADRGICGIAAGQCGLRVCRAGLYLTLIISGRIHLSFQPGITIV